MLRFAKDFRKIYDAIMIDKIKLDNYEKIIEGNISNYKKASAQKVSKIEEVIRIANEKLRKRKNVDSIY